MSEVERTRHQCPICQEIVYNDKDAYHFHLNTVCANSLFVKYPELKQFTFNALWHKINGMVQNTIIIPSGKKGVSATIIDQETFDTERFASEPMPYQANLEQSTTTLDLEELDRKIKVKEKQLSQQRKRHRSEMEADAIAELNDDAFSQLMPKLFTSDKHQKRRLLYHNTADIRPPKRTNIDPAIPMPLFRHKIRESRHAYHSVAYDDLVPDANASAQQKNGTAPRVTVDEHPAVIHTQQALSRYLAHCEMLRKCTDFDLFQKIAKKFEDVHAVNCENTIKATLQEINVWQNMDNDHDSKQQNEEEQTKETQQQAFSECWSEIPRKTDRAELQELLKDERFSGFYASLLNHDNVMNTDEPYSFWNASDNVKQVHCDIETPKKNLIKL